MALVSDFIKMSMMLQQKSW